VNNTHSKSDKRAGVVVLTMLDLKRRGKISRIGLCGTNGTKFVGMRAHLQACIGDVYGDMDVDCIETWPGDAVVSDPYAYRTALATFAPGDVAIVFTPDDTHFEIAMAAVEV